MRKDDTPVARAASMNSRFFRLSVWPRTMRLMSSQLISPMPRNSIDMDRPNITKSRISTNM